MKSIEIHPEGQFKHWNTERLSELNSNTITDIVGEKLLFENETIKVWSIHLKPNQRLPFHKHTKNYNWTCLTEGKAISHFETGRIVEIGYIKGDLSYYDFEINGDFIHDLENIGNSILKFITIEYK